jgi:hypothetical protein
MDNTLRFATSHRRAVELLLGRSNLNNNEWLQIREMAPRWETLNFPVQSGTYLRHGIHETQDEESPNFGRPVLYRTRSNVQAGRLPPNQNTNDYERIAGQ